MGGTRGTHPGIKVPDLPPGLRPISHSPGGLREPGGVGSPDLSPIGLLWGKVQLMGALPCHQPLLKNKQ